MFIITSKAKKFWSHVDPSLDKIYIPKTILGNICLNIRKRRESIFLRISIMSKIYPKSGISKPVQEQFLRYQAQ